MHGGEPCRGLAVVVAAPASAQVVVLNSQQISCLDGSFLECSLPTLEARGSIPGWDMSVLRPLEEDRDDPGQVLYSGDPGVI